MKIQKRWPSVLLAAVIIVFLVSGNSVALDVCAEEPDNVILSDEEPDTSIDDRQEDFSEKSAASIKDSVMEDRTETEVLTSAAETDPSTNETDSQVNDTEEELPEEVSDAETVISEGVTEPENGTDSAEPEPSGAQAHRRVNDTEEEAGIEALSAENDKESETVSVTITWTAMEFTYTDGEWNPIDGGGASYDAETNTYTVTPNGTPITITVSGTNFENMTYDNTIHSTPNSYSYPVIGAWRIDAVNNTASCSFRNSSFQNCTTAYEIQYSNDGGKNWKNSGVKVLYVTEFVSVDVAWGAMSFTYNDADEADNVAEGWACADGANQITVTNNGEVTVDAAVKYEAAADCAAITGAFDLDSAALAQNENKIFTLTLSGKPESALNDATIGTATVTITKYSD